MVLLSVSQGWGSGLLISQPNLCPFMHLVYPRPRLLPRRLRFSSAVHWFERPICPGVESSALHRGGKHPHAAGGNFLHGKPVPALWSEPPRIPFSQSGGAAVKHRF